MKINATVTLACGHVVPFRDYRSSRVPVVGQQLHCYEDGCRDEREVIQVEIEWPAPPDDDGPGQAGNESEFIWSE